MRNHPISRRLCALTLVVLGVVSVPVSAAGAATASSASGDGTASATSGDTSSASSDDAGAATPAPDGGAPTTTEPTTPAPPAQPNIIGGSVAPDGAWPAQVALFVNYPGEGSFFQCGGTVIDPSWVLTAAHCVADSRWADDEWAPSYSVLVGSQDRANGGQRIRVRQVVIRPSFSYNSFSDDVALLQLDRPTDAVRPLEVASRTDIPPSGATLTVAGWGQSETVPSAQRTLLRQVDVPAMGGTECRDAVNEASMEFQTPGYHSSFLCTGPIGTGGIGPCYGDSGGPLVWETGGRKVLVGIVSWGPYCASPETPSVFSKVASASRWIAQTIQYGPHWDATDFAYSVADSYLDYTIYGDDVIGVPLEPTPGEPGAYIASLHQRSIVTRRDAVIVRLYQAVLGRRAENHGYQYWRQRMLWDRVSATRVAEVMARSAEFRTTYGSLSNTAFVEQLYLNVLGRAGAPGDVAYWAGRLAGGESRGRIVLLIAESAENRARTQAAVNTQVVFMNLLGRVPADYELAQWSPKPVADTARFLVHSVAYARRWGGYYFVESGAATGR